MTADEARDWARNRLRGVANTLIASYTSDLRDINEAAIRHDVRLEIEHGFMGFLAASETALTPDEYVRFVEIAADEAQGRALVIHHASFNTLDENIEVGEKGGRCRGRARPPGVSAELLSELGGMTSTSTRSGSATGLTSPSCSSRCHLWGFERLHPASLSIEIMEQLIDDCPNIVAVKAEGGHPGIGGFVETWQRLSRARRRERAVGVGRDAARHAGAAAVQRDVEPGVLRFHWCPRIFEHIQSNEYSEAMALYWMMDPARRANGKIGAFGGTNMVHRTAWKYQAWLNGYNGGPIRMPAARLLYDQMAMLRNGLIASGLPVDR